MDDLFSTEPSPLREEFKASLGGWSDVLSIDALQSAKAALKVAFDDAHKGKVYPDGGDIFRLYRDLPLDKIKIVILGQDPYHDGNAMGYAFGCKMKMSPSLRQILCAMEDDVTNNINFRKDLELHYLVEQGVFLLNTLLTVKAGSPKSHVGIGWEEFTSTTIDTISALSTRPVVYMLWGKDAQTYEKHLIGHNNTRRLREHNDLDLVLKCEHPAAAAYRNEQWQCTHFSKANEYLEANSIEPIKWL
jgi:uracil-DNA glycosylase